VEAAARRQKWIDQAQSLNIYMAGASGKKLDDTYKLAWVRGLKTTYYLRTMSATHAEKSTVTAGRLNAVSSGVDTRSGGTGMSALEKAASRAEPDRCRGGHRRQVLRHRRPDLRSLPVSTAMSQCDAIEQHSCMAM
jgi:ribonucleotide reductase alpha subunit